jgi:hypothetical protein
LANLQADQRKGHAMKSFLESLKMWQKFALIGFFVLALFGLPFTLYMRIVNSEVNVADLQRMGADVIPPATK